MRTKLGHIGGVVGAVARGGAVVEAAASGEARLVVGVVAIDAVAVVEGAGCLGSDGALARAVGASGLAEASSIEARKASGGVTGDAGEVGLLRCAL